MVDFETAVLEQTHIDACTAPQKITSSLSSSFTDSHSTSWNFQDSAGVTVTAGTTFEAGLSISGISAKASETFSVSFSNTFTYGESGTTQQAVQLGSQCSTAVDPQKAATLQLTAILGKLNADIVADVHTTYNCQGSDPETQTKTTTHDGTIEIDNVFTQSLSTVCKVTNYGCTTLSNYHLPPSFWNTTMFAEGFAPGIAAA